MPDPTTPPPNSAPGTAATPLAKKATLATMLASPRGLWRFLRDPQAPLSSKILAVVTILYVVSPLDAIPDWIFPVVGWLDDVGVTAAALAWVAAQAARYANEHPEIGARPVSSAPAEKPSSR